MHRDTYFIVPVHVKSCEPKACAQSAEMSLLNSQSYSQPRLTRSPREEPPRKLTKRLTLIFGPGIRDGDAVKVQPRVELSDVQ